MSRYYHEGPADSVLGSLGIGMIGGLLISAFIGIAVEQWFINKEKDEIFLVDKHKNVYVCCTDTQTGRRTLHEVDINHIKDDYSQNRVDYNGITFKCNQPMNNQEFVMSEEKPLEEEYDVICPDCCCDD